MQLTLPPDVLKSLPAPDEQGVVRVNAALKMGDKPGEVSIVAVNDMPVPAGKDDAGDDTAADDNNPMPEGDLPDLGAMTDSIYKPGPGGQ